MGRSHQTFNKSEKEKKKRKKRQEKLEKKRQRKLEKAENGPKSFEDMIMYVDEDGNFTSTPPDPKKKKKEVKLEDIQLGAAKREDVDPIRKGRVKFFSEEKGYGFITDLSNGEGIFVHSNNVEGHIGEKDMVTFEIAIGPKGQYATNVKIDNSKPEKTPVSAPVAPK